MLSHPYMQPIGIYDDSNNLIGMLHDVTYVRPERVLQQSLEEDRNNLIALRSKIGNDFIETTIVGKTNGHINQFRDGFRKLSELMPGPIEFAIATSSIQLNTSKTTIVDDLINKPKYKVGQVYAITYTPNGQKIAIPVKTTQVKEHPEVLNELLAAFDAFAEGKISQNQLKEVFSKYIYSTPTSEKLDAAGKNFKREADGKDRMYIDYDSLNVDGIVFGKSGDTKRFLSSRTPKEDIEKLRKIFISILSESYININFEKVKNESFVKNFTTSNVRFYKLPDGRVTVFDNPVISISTSFASGIKPIEKTEEQPRVEPTPQVQTIEEIKNSIAQFRAQEQAEYAAMSDPNDTVEKEKIYNKYDKLITPLLNQAEADIEAERNRLEQEKDQKLNELFKSIGLAYTQSNLDIIAERSDKKAVEFIEKHDLIIADYDAKLAALEPTIQPEETKTTFTSNNGLEFDIDFEDDVDLLPMFTEVKSGVQELFDSNPELASIGTLEQYSQYLDSIFPDSQVKDIVYHGSLNAEKIKKEGFVNKQERDKGYIGEGYYFTQYNDWKSYTGDITGVSDDQLKKLNVILNIKNPQLINNEADRINLLSEPNVDGRVLLFDYDENLTIEDAIKEGKVRFNLPLNQFNEIVVFKPEQIHILGTKQDIEGFNQFVQSGKQIEKSLSLQDKVNNLIQEGKITKFCK